MDVKAAHDLLVIDCQGANAATLMPLLSQWSLTDGEGLQADRLSLTFDGSDALDALPASGSEWTVTIEGQYRGRFQVSTLDEHLEPDKLVMQLTPAKFNVADTTRWREPRTRTFVPATLADVVTSVMSAHGYEVRIDAELGAKPTDHLNQNEETDKAFIARLAEKYDAIAKPIDNLYVFGRRGQLATLSGQTKPVVSVSPNTTRRGSVKIRHPSNVRYSGIKAPWQTPETGESDVVTIGEAPFYRLKETGKNPDDARQRAEAKLAAFKRHGQHLTLTTEGQPGFFAEAVLTLSGFRSPRAAGEWSIDRVTLSGTRTQYSIHVEATRPT